MPELANVQDDDSTADFDSESAFDLDDDDKSVDLAFAGNAKVTFIDDNHNFVSMYDESESTMNLNGDEDGDISIVAANDILNTRFTTSNSMTWRETISMMMEKTLNHLHCRQAF